MKATATDAKLTGTPSVYVKLGYGNNGFEATRVETYFRFSAQWRGQVIEGSITADTYQHSSGWSEQRLSGIHTDTPVTDTARESIRLAISPFAMGWVSGPDYNPARRRAYARSIAGELRSTVYGDFRELIASADLESGDRSALRRASDKKADLMQLLSIIGQE